MFPWGQTPCSPWGQAQGPLSKRPHSWYYIGLVAYDDIYRAKERR